MSKSWSDRLREGRPHHVKPVPIDFAGMTVGQIMLVPSPRIVADFIRRIPQGRAMTLGHLRTALARRHRAQVTCPVTMGFHLRIVAEAVWEAHCAGVGLPDLVPVWRVLDDRGPTLKKLPRAAAVWFRARRSAEGI